MELFNWFWCYFSI